MDHMNQWIDQFNQKKYVLMGIKYSAAPFHWNAKPNHQVLW